jgi:hypothetical protein
MSIFTTMSDGGLSALAPYEGGKSNLGLLSTGKKHCKRDKSISGVSLSAAAGLMTPQLLLVTWCLDHQEAEIRAILVR